MKRAGFILDTEGNIKKHTTEGVEYVHFYKDDHIIPIPYEFLVCFVANNINEPKPVPPNVARLEKLLIDTKTYLEKN